MKPPRRRIIDRKPRYPGNSYWTVEKLECGHKIGGENRASAQRRVYRRCKQCQEKESE
jgi:hypothetical protein